MKMLLPSDIMNSRDKRNYQKNYIIGEYNMYKEIVSYEIFKTWDQEQQINALKVWKKNYNTREIANKMGILEWRVYDLTSKLGLSSKTNPRTQKVKKGKAEKIQEISETPKTTQLSVTEVIPKQELINFFQNFNLLSARKSQNVFSYEFSGQHDSQNIINKVQKILIMLENESGLFDVNISISEIASSKENEEVK